MWNHYGDADISVPEYVEWTLPNKTLEKSRKTVYLIHMVYENQKDNTWAFGMTLAWMPIGCITLTGHYYMT